MTKDELEQAQAPWLELLETKRGQNTVMKAVQGLRDDMESLKQLFQSDSTLIVPAKVKTDRLPRWPFALGLTVAAAGATMMLVEEYRLHEAINARAPVGDLEQIIRRRDTWRLPVLVSGGGALGYIVARAAVGPSAERRGFDVFIGRNAVGLAWHARTD